MNNVGRILPTLPMSVRGQDVGSLSRLSMLVNGRVSGGKVSRHDVDESQRKL